MTAPLEAAPSDSAQARWQALAAKAAGGAVAALRSRSADGLVIEPLYARTPTDPAQPWRGTEAWGVAPRVDDPDPARANVSALLELEGGADALTLVAAGSPYDRGFGLPATREAFDRALAGVDLDFIGLRLDAGHDLEAAKSIAALVEARRLTSADLRLDFGFDPIGALARTGLAPSDDALRALVDLAGDTSAASTALVADGRLWHEAGAGEIQDLAATLATAVAHLRALEALGLALDAARGLIAVLLAVDADVLLGIAKMRAMRRLWARVETASGLAPRPLRLHAETAWRMMTRHDPFTNVMRATAACVGAGLGGADTVTVLPMSLVAGLPDDDTRRLARNVGRVLIDEAMLGKVADPAAGSGALDTLTAELCEAAWRRFQTIEAEGGIARALTTGTLRAAIATTAAARAATIASREAGLVGTSLYPALDTPAIPVLEAPRRATAAGLLPSRRDAEPFEALRAKADDRAATGRRPAVFLATLGAPAAFGPRAIFAANLFAIAGLDARPPLAAGNLAETTAAFAASGARVACLCATDAAYAAYADDAAALARALLDAGATLLLMAGPPADVWRACGVDAFLHEGCDTLAILRTCAEAAGG